MTTVGNIQRSIRVNKAYVMVNTGKILITSKITIEGFGSRFSTGEGWATRAQAQAFRRACAEFGLGRYLRELEAWNYRVQVNAKGYFNRPHISVLPDSAIHPSELAEARKVRSRMAVPSRKHPVPGVTVPLQGGSQPPLVAVSSPRMEPAAVTTTHGSRFAPSAQASEQTLGTAVIIVGETRDEAAHLHAAESTGVQAAEGEAGSDLQRQFAQHLFISTALLFDATISNNFLIQ